MWKKLFGVLLVFVLMSSFVLAELTLSEPLGVYSLGDKMHIVVSGIVGSYTGNLKIDLVCGNRTTTLVKIPANTFSDDEEISYAVSKILDKNDLDIEDFGEVLGECRIRTSLNSGASSTGSFQISDKMDVEVTLDKTVYDPTDLITLRINAVNANGELVDGFVDINGDYTFSKAIVSGFASESFYMSPTTEAGIYKLNISAYDVGNSGTLNHGGAEISFSINQVPSFIVISLSDSEVSPGEVLSIGAEVFDQAGEEMEGEILIRLSSPNLEERDLSIQTGEFEDFYFDTNSTAGVWRVISRFGDIFEEREFQVLEVQKVEFEINETVLIITNVGNVVYNKTIDVQIGNDTNQLDLVIEVGDVRKFSLKAPSGEYSVSVGDGDSFIDGTVLLTGRAISVKSLKDVGPFSSYYIVWIFLIIVIGLTAITFLLKSKKTKTLGPSNFREKLNDTANRIKGLKNKFPLKIQKIGDVGALAKGKIPRSIRSDMSNSLNLTNKSPKVVGLDSSHGPKDDTMVDLTSKKTGVAEATLVLKGEKHKSAVLALSIKNLTSMKTHAKTALVNVINEARGNKGLVDWKENHAFIVFSPLVTKTYNNELLAVKSGFEIKRGLEDFNKKFREKIEFNMGVHLGDLVSSKKGGKLRYTSLGNIISLAKRISDSDSSKLLVSDEIRRKMMRDLKTHKVHEIGKNQIYEVTEIKDREANAAKLKDLLKRM